MSMNRKRWKAELSVRWEVQELDKQLRAAIREEPYWDNRNWPAQLEAVWLDWSRLNRCGKRRTHEKAKDAMYEHIEQRNRGKPWAQTNRQYRAMRAYRDVVLP